MPVAYSLNCPGTSAKLKSALLCGLGQQPSYLITEGDLALRRQSSDVSPGRTLASKERLPKIVERSELHRDLQWPLFDIG